MAQAMDVGDEVTESSISSLIMDSLESIEKGKALSPEDIAWADSCLIKESDILEDNWNSLKGALLEILDSQPEALSSSAPMGDGLPREANIEILPQSDGAETERFRRIQNDLLPISEAERSDDDMPTNDDTNILQSSTFTGNPFLPGYNDDLRVTENLELGANMSSSVSEMEPSTEDIFRVWDLDVSVEEDELVTQLNKALEESLPQSIPPTSDDSDVWKNLKVDSVENLIAGFTDLSLDQTSS